MKIKQELLAQIKSCGERAFPEECAGVLFGKIESDGRHVTELFPVKNSAREKRTEFAVSSADLRSAEKAAILKNLDVLGFYHSHADFDAIASKKDAEFAIPNLSYPIVSVLGGKAAVVRSFAFAGVKNANFCEEEIVCL